MLDKTLFPSTHHTHSSNAVVNKALVNMVNFPLTAGPCNLRMFIWQFAINNNIIIIYTTDHEQCFHYKHSFVNLLSNLALQLLSIFCHFFHKWWISSHLENLQFTGGADQLWSQLNAIHWLWSGEHHIHQFIWTQHNCSTCLNYNEHIQFTRHMWLREDIRKLDYEFIFYHW